jgi:hypothetical protein
MGDAEKEKEGLDKLVNTAQASIPGPEDGPQPPEVDPPPVSNDPEDA